MPFFQDNSISHDITTNAGFRAWAAMVHKALVEVGMVQTSDTGQINLETAETPAVNSTYAGYEIFRFDDALQATQPIFIKVEYGRGAAEGRPALRITYGRGSNGSGTLTTASSTVTFAAASKTESENKGYIYCSFHDGALTLYDVVQPNVAGSILVAVERLKGLSGTAIDAFAFSASNLDPRRTLYRQSTGTYVAAETTGAAPSHGDSGLVLPAQIYLINPITTAPLIGVQGIQPEAYGDAIGDEFGTGHSDELIDLELNGQIITYQRIPTSVNMQFGAWTTTNTAVTRHLLIPHMS